MTGKKRKGSEGTEGYVASTCPGRTNRRTCHRCDPRLVPLHSYLQITTLLPSLPRVNSLRECQSAMGQVQRLTQAGKRRSARHLHHSTAKRLSDMVVTGLSKERSAA